MKSKYKWGHLSDYDPKNWLTQYKGATKDQFEKKNTIPDQAVDIKKLVKRVENGRPNPIISK
jgi:hypothetical protein